MALTELVPFTCPTCGGDNLFLVDPSLRQPYEQTEDCTVCCHPLVLRVHFDNADEPQLQVRSETG